MHTLPDSIRLEKGLADDVWPILVDRSLFENVLLNLIINARDALSDNGRILVETQNTSNVNSQSTCEPPGNGIEEYVSVSITDEGTGMTLQVLDQAFEPFFSTKTETDGSGLGLSMANGFLEQSNGRISVTSAPGKGTSVHLLFPRCFSEFNMTHDNAVNELQNAVSARRVLVVEDLVTVREVIVEQLQVLGYDTVEACNGREALAQIESDSSIDLMLSDVVMPGELQGIELAQRVKQIRPDVKIVIMSGYPNGNEQSKVESEIHFTKLTKPVSLADLSSALQEKFNNVSIAVAVKEV